MVLELSVVEGGKGRAVDALRLKTGADAVLFLGDDVTDEEAFAALRPPDLGLKVGPGATIAEHRIGGEVEAAVLLARLIGLRAAPAQLIPSVPIEQHALLSDQRTVALETPRGRITWLCLPRIDSSAIMADLVGGRSAGYFEVSGIGGAQPTQRYEGDSFVLHTRWGGLGVTDYLDCSGGRPYQRAGRSDLIRVVEGQGPFRVVFAPRVDFGRVATRLVVGPDGVEVEGAVDPIVLRAPGLAWRVVADGHHQTAVAHGRVQPDRPMVLELRYGTRSFAPAVVSEPERRQQSIKFWANWAGSLRVPPLHEALVRRSALVIKSLAHGPSGAVAAAATTSLPETIGGMRNWDYRFCWPRDAALAASALLRLGNTGVAMRLLDWLVGVVGRLESPDRLRPIYTVNGHELGAEAEIGELSGYEGSRPVRVGNGAAHQVQLDVFGPITEMVSLLLGSGAPLTPEYWRLVQSMAAAVEARWEEPDHGIWEIRGPRRHHVHTKIMCWQTMDRAITIAGLHMGRVPDGWGAVRDRIAAEVLERGVDTAAKRWFGAYGDPAPDASVLHAGLSGLVKPEDPRFAWAVESVERDLLEGPTVLRYRMDDGLAGREGGFHICTGWLAESYALMGRREEALRLLERLCGLAGPLGLLSEQVDPASGRALGNHPQAYSHLAVVNACVRLAGGA
jgi:GH15 family glucan-1,4-alpha-glucosidase